MFVVQSNRTLDGIIADDIAVSEVLGDNTRAGLILLLEVMGIARCVFGVGASEITDASGAGNLDLRTTKLCVVE